MPEDSVSLKARISLTDSVIALDPTQRGLSLGEQLRRSRNLMQVTLATARRCLAAQAPQVAAALDSSETLLVAPTSTEGQRQSIEQTLLLASSCGAPRTRCAPGGGRALALVHNRSRIGALADQCDICRPDLEPAFFIFPAMYVAPECITGVS